LPHLLLQNAGQKLERKKIVKSSAPLTNFAVEQQYVWYLSDSLEVLKPGTLAASIDND
jgi:hypothetical protein